MTGESNNHSHQGMFNMTGSLFAKVQICASCNIAIEVDEKLYYNTRGIVNHVSSIKK